MKFSTTIAGSKQISDAMQATRAQTAGTTRSSSAQPTKNKLDTAKRFEAMVMQNLISAMLPKNATHVYGKGLAGDTWKSMLSQQLAETLAARHRFGFADSIAPKAAEASAPPPQSVPPVAVASTEPTGQTVEPTR